MEYGTGYSNIYPTRCNFTQFILSGNCSTCCGWNHHPSSGAQTTVSTASGICHRYCYLPLSWKSWYWFECAVGGVRHPQHTSDKIRTIFTHGCEFGPTWSKTANHLQNNFWSRLYRHTNTMTTRSRYVKYMQDVIKKIYSHEIRKRLILVTFVTYFKHLRTLKNIFEKVFRLSRRMPLKSLPHTPQATQAS